MANNPSDSTNVPGAAQATANQTSSSVLPPNAPSGGAEASKPQRGVWDRVAAFFKRPEGIATAIAAAGVAAWWLTRDGSGRSDDEAEEQEPESFPGWPTPMTAAERLEVNREQAVLFENSVGQALVDGFPDARIVPQVTVRTPDGKKRRMDFAVAHRNGSVTPVEVKNVSELTEKHVQQAEDHRAGLKHSLGVRSGRTIVVVPEHAEVSEELAARVRVVRHPV